MEARWLKSEPGAVQQHREEVYVALQWCHELVLCVYVKCVKNLLLRSISENGGQFSSKRAQCRHDNFPIWAPFSLLRLSGQTTF